MEGTVKWYNRKKGYGFITGDDKEDYFVHYSALPEKTFLMENDSVSFEGAQSDKGNQASKIEILQKASEKESPKEEVESQVKEE